MTAKARVTLLSATEALVEVTYPDGKSGIERVTKPLIGSLLDAAYQAASTKALIQGLTLGAVSFVG